MTSSVKLSFYSLLSTMIPKQRLYLPRTTGCRKLEIMEMEVMSFTLILFVTTNDVMKCQTPTTLVPL